MCIKDIGIRLTSPGPNHEPDPLLKLDPDIYQVMIMRIGEFPAFTYHGVPTNWPDVNVGNAPVLDYYYKSPGLPYINGSGDHWPSYTRGQFFNIGFHYNATVDRYMERLMFADRTTSQEIMNNLTKHCQTWQYPEIFISHTPWGFAIDKDWELRYFRDNSFQYIKHIGSSPSPPPGDIALSSDAGTPDINGNFNLIWNVSSGADNYSLYRYGNPITQINGSLDLIAYQTAMSPFPISGLIDGEYYFVVVAHNQYGNTTSNNIHITVQIAEIPPESFILSTDADFPDDDGFFNLSWTISDGVDNYSLYMHNSQITVIDSSLTLLVDQTAVSPFSVSGLSNGEYYFVVVAYNQYGDTLSNNVHVTVNIPGEPSAPGISGYNTFVILGIVIFTAGILFKKKKIRFKRK